MANEFGLTKEELRSIRALITWARSKPFYSALAEGEKTFILLALKELAPTLDAKLARGVSREPADLED